MTSEGQLTLVCATRCTHEAFAQQTLLGACLSRLGDFSPFGLLLSHGHQAPLAELYNQAIDKAAPDDVLVFVHDDVHIDDWMLAARLREALQQFDVVGVAGTRRRQPGQWAWYLQPLQDTPEGVPDWSSSVRDTEFLSGAVAHGNPGQRNHITFFGPSPSEVCLLDGVLLAARAWKLQQHGVRFDPALAFHFYDLDFCRTAQAAGLRLGTWPLAITHQSGGGSIHSPAWLQARERYVGKWGS
jgi:GT2 family glycosyltransferase